MPIKKIKPMSERIVEEHINNETKEEISGEGQTIEVSKNKIKEIKEKQAYIKIKDISTQKEKSVSISDIEKMQKTNLKENPVFLDIEGKMLLVRVGDKENEANDDDIKNIENRLNELLDSCGVKCLVFVTHDKVDIQIVR